MEHEKIELQLSSFNRQDEFKIWYYLGYFIVNVK
jgi:hypothetical protein